jgi:hypothetical protein
MIIFEIKISKNTCDLTIITKQLHQKAGPYKLSLSPSNLWRCELGPSSTMMMKCGNKVRVKLGLCHIWDFTVSMSDCAKVGLFCQHLMSKSRSGFKLDLARVDLNS